MGHKKVIPPSPAVLGLPLTGCDSHAHIASPALWPDIEGVLSRAKEAGVARIGLIFLRHQLYMEKKNYFADKSHVFFVMGVHPTDLLDLQEGEFEQILDDIRADFSSCKRIRAVGEIGLDYFWKEVSPELQISAFRRQLRFAREMNLPVVIHSRDAYEDTLSILDEEGFAQRPLLWHCFGGNAEQARDILSRGWHISIPGPVTYKANADLREALHVIPLDRLLVETDCPYLSPEPWRGKTNEPALSAFTAAAIAQELGISAAELWTICGENAVRFFGLK